MFSFYKWFFLQLFETHLMLLKKFVVFKVVFKRTKNFRASKCIIIIVCMCDSWYERNFLDFLVCISCKRCNWSIKLYPRNYLLSKTFKMSYLKIIQFFGECWRGVLDKWNNDYLFIKHKKIIYCLFILIHVLDNRQM